MRWLNQKLASISLVLQRRIYRPSRWIRSTKGIFALPSRWCAPLHIAAKRGLRIPRRMGGGAVAGGFGCERLGTARAGRRGGGCGLGGGGGKWAQGVGVAERAGAGGDAAGGGELGRTRLSLGEHGQVQWGVGLQHV